MGQPREAHKSPYLKPVRFGLIDSEGRPAPAVIAGGDEVWFEVEAELSTLDNALCIGYAIFTEAGELLYWSYQTDQPEGDWPVLTRGRNVLRSRLPRRLFNEGTYRVELIASLHIRDWLMQPGVSAPAVFVKVQGDLSDSPYWMAQRPGILAPVIPWTRCG